MNTADVLAIVGEEGEEGTDLGQPSLDLASATRLAFAYNTEFGEWLIDTFAGYSLETLVRPIDWVWENQLRIRSMSVPDASFHCKLPVWAANASAIKGIQRGLQGMYEGTGEDAEDAFASLERELGIAEQP